MGDSGFFRRMASTLTLEDFAEVLMEPIDSSVAGEAAWEHMITAEWPSGAPGWFCVVREGDRDVGYVTYDGDYFHTDSPTMKQPVSEFVEPFVDSQIVPLHTSLFDALPALVDHFWLFLRDGKNITHVLTYESLDSIPFHAALMTLMLEAEHYMTALISREPGLIAARFASLSPRRQEKAYETEDLVKAHRRAPSYTGVGPGSARRPRTPTFEFTTFIDKATTFIRDADL